MTEETIVMLLTLLAEAAIKFLQFILALLQQA